MRRNQVQFKKWEADLVRARCGLLPEELPEQELRQIQTMKPMVMSPSNLSDKTREISKTLLPVATAQPSIDHPLLIKNRVRQKPVREYAKEIAQLYQDIMEDPIALLGAIGQTCDFDRPRNLSADYMDSTTDYLRNFDSQSATAQELKRDLENELEKTGGKNMNFNQLMDGATEAQMTSFVAEVCASLEMLTGKYLSRQGV
jgi:hypothetical protein